MIKPFCDLCDHEIKDGVNTIEACREIPNFHHVGDGEAILMQMDLPFVEHYCGHCCNIIGQSNMKEIVRAFIASKQVGR